MWSDEYLYTSIGFFALKGAAVVLPKFNIAFCCPTFKSTVPFTRSGFSHIMSEIAQKINVPPSLNPITFDANRRRCPEEDVHQYMQINFSISTLCNNNVRRDTAAWWGRLTCLQNSIQESLSVLCSRRRLYIAQCLVGLTLYSLEVNNTEEEAYWMPA